MAVDSVRTARASFDLKSASLPVVAVVLKTTDAAVLGSELALRMADSPAHDNGAMTSYPTPALSMRDLAAVRDLPEPLDFVALLALLRSHQTMPVAVRGGSPEQMQAAHQAGLALAADVSAPPAAHVSDAPAMPDSLVEVEAPRPFPGLATVVIDKPLRSGQQVYARGADLVVLAVVSFGAEVIADGNIHVYAPLRGRAMAGARGNTNARIFTTCMEPQLVSIAGIYRTTEVAIPADIVGKPAQVRLAGEKLLIEPL